MSRVTKHRCEKCERETEDISKSIGWIVISSADVRGYGDNTTFEITTVVSGPNQSYVRERQARYDFCSTSCLVGWVSAKIVAAEKRYEEYKKEHA